MDGLGSKKQPDVSLAPFLQAGEGEESDREIASLLADHTESTIKGIVRSKLRVSLSATENSHHNQDALEIVGDIQSAVLSELRCLKSCTDSRTITNFRAYVASTAFNACHRYLRRKYPKRYQLKNKLRYLLSHQENFGLRESDAGEWLCGHLANLDNVNPATRGDVQGLLENKEKLDDA
jgi:hypothetical protein